MSKRLRSYLAVIMAALFAFAIVAVPKTAWAAPANSIETDYGTLGYIADDDGYELDVKIYVNDQLSLEINNLPIIRNQWNDSLTFEAAEGYSYYGGESSYDLKTNRPSFWTQSTGYISFGGDSDVDKSYPSVLSIYLYTMEEGDYAWLNIYATDNSLVDYDNNPGKHLKGYRLSYDVTDPVSGKIRTVTRDITDSYIDLVTINFEDQIVPKNTPIKLSAICDSGYEAQSWSLVSVGEATLTADEGTEGVAGYYKKGDTATLEIWTVGLESRISVEVHRVRKASAPTQDEVRGQLGDAAVVVKCNNGFASHDEMKSALGEDSTFSIGVVRKEDGKAYVDVTVTPDSYISAYDSETEGSHSLVNKDQDKVITFVHDDSEWVPADNESPLVFEVTCNAEPTAPTLDQINGLIGGVDVSCTNAEAKHYTANFDLIEDSYEGNLTSNEDGSYTYTVTISADKYVKAYTEASGATHTLAGDKTATVILTNSGEGWKVKEGIPVEFMVACVSAPTLDEIDGVFKGKLVEVSCLNEGATHGDKNKTYGAIGGGVQIGEVTENGTVDITIYPGAYATKYGEEVKLGHYLDPYERNPVTVTLTLGEDGKWTVSESKTPIEVTVKCADAPIPELPRTEDEFKAVFEDSAIHVTCEANTGHGTEKYMPEDGYYTYSDVEGNATEGYTVTMTVGPDHYVNLYNQTIGKMHVLAEGETEERVINLVCNDGMSWKVDDDSAPVTYKVVCTDDDPYQPGKPTPVEVEELLGSQAVLLDCTTNVGHADGSYSLLDGTYSIAEVQGDKVDGYKSSITITADEYVKKYSDETKVTHELDADTNTVTINLKYVDADGWKLEDQSQKQVRFNVKCQLSAPTYDELKELFGSAVIVDCTTNDQHYDKTYGLIENTYRTTDPAYTNGKWTLNVTIASEEYVEEFVTAYGGAEHTLTDANQREATFALVYNTADHKWETTEGAAPVTFTVKCGDGTSGTITVTPADMTIYEGGDEGYEGVVDGEGKATKNTSLPEPMYTISAPEGVDPATLTIENGGNTWKVESTEEDDLYRLVPSTDSGVASSTPTRTIRL